MIAAHDLDTYKTDVFVTVTFDSVCASKVSGASCIVLKFPGFHLLIGFAKMGICLIDVEGRCTLPYASKTKITHSPDTTVYSWASPCIILELSAIFISTPGFR
ncbi:hypothetical protein BDR22DRAFT_259071 [Usnea florida]